MRDEFLKRFAVIFSILVFLSANDARVYLNSDIDYRSDDSLFDLEKDFYPEEPSKLPSNDVATFQPPEKRFVGLGLLGVAVLSAGFDIYKQEAGCAASHKRLVANVEYTNKWIKIAKARRDAINLAWNPIVAAEGYFSRLGSEITIMRAHISKIDSLKSDIVQLLDQDYFTKVDLVKREIENDINRLNDTNFGDPNAYLAKFFSTTGYAITLSAKLGPVAIWLGAKAFGPAIAKAFAQRLARSYASGNPGLIARGIHKYQKHGLFPGVRNFWNRMVTTPFQNAFARLSPKVQGRLIKAGKGIKILGKGAVVGAFLAYEIYNGWKFFDGCDKKEKESEDSRKLVDGSIANMTKVTNDMNKFKNDLYINYGMLFGNITSDDAMELVEEVYNMTVASQFQNKTIEENARNIKDYEDNIKSAKIGDNNYDFKKVEALTKKLNTAFLKTAFKLDCYRKKMVIIASITRDCASGVGTGDSLWDTAKKLEGNTLVDCIENQKYLSKNEVLATIKGVMGIQQKSSICLRNSKDKLDLVCGDWRSYKTDIQIKAKHKDLTAADITHFVSKCSPANVTSTDTQSICSYKAQKKSLSFIKNDKKRHDQAQVLSAYEGCLLTSDQKKSICSSKKSHIRENIVQTDYPGYNDFSPTYKACPPDSSKICLLVLYLGATADSPVFANDTIIYGKPAIEKAVNGCPKPGDTPDVYEDEHENALDMLSDSIEEESMEKRLLFAAANAEVSDQSGTKVSDYFDPRMICEDHKSYGPSYTKIKHKLTDAELKNILHECPLFEMQPRE